MVVRLANICSTYSIRDRRRAQASFPPATPLIGAFMRGAFIPIDADHGVDGSATAVAPALAAVTVFAPNSHSRVHAKAGHHRDPREHSSRWEPPSITAPHASHTEPAQQAGSPPSLGNGSGSASHSGHSSGQPIRLLRSPASITQGRSWKGGWCRTCWLCPQESRATKSPASSRWNPRIVRSTRPQYPWIDSGQVRHQVVVTYRNHRRHAVGRPRRSDRAAGQWSWVPHPRVPA